MESNTQPTPKGLGDEVVPFLIEKLQERRALGIQRYGEALTTFNGRDNKQDALEELLDFVQYFTGKLLEDSADPDKLQEIREAYAKRLSDLEAENTRLKTDLALAKAQVTEVNERTLALTQTLSTAFLSADEALKSLAFRCATNLLLES